MIQLSAEVLALSGEPALLARGGKILYANEAACSLLGRDLAGGSVQTLLGPEVSGMQASSFVGETGVLGRRVLLRTRTLDGLRVIFLSPCGGERKLIGDAFFYALRSELMQLGISAEVIQSRVSPDDAAAVSALRGVTHSLYRANRMLQNLTVIRGEEENSLPFHPQPLDLSALLRDLFDAVRLALPQPEIRFTAPDHLTVMGGPFLLEMLTLNLISNCVRHAEGCTCIRVNLRAAGDQVILSVDDDGCGIPGDRLHTVLERFRFSGGPQDLPRGAGLGLTAVRTIARLHGGTLLLESREGIGTAVRVSLSLAPRSVTPLQAAQEDYDRSFDTILTGLATCLPPEAFDPKAREQR